MKEAIHALKYDRLHPAADRLGEMLAAAIAQLAGASPVEMVVVPVPLHKSKYAERGFNQARALATSALKALSKRHSEWRLTLAANILVRSRATTSQAGLTTRMRRLNVRGAFTVSDPQAVAGKNILLVDDIFTTGSTVRAAASVLARAGAASIWVATLARARRITDFGSRVSFEDEDQDVERAISSSQTSIPEESTGIDHSSHEQSSF